jgi:predicted secreted protein
MNPSKTLSLKQESKETSINVKQGEIFNISLEGNITTGYSWFLNNKEELIKSKIIPLNLDDYNSAEYISVPHEEGMVGFGGTFNFLFKLENNSNLPKIIFEYLRSFEPENIVYRVEVTINVEN